MTGEGAATALPHNLDAEMSLLGAVLLDNDALGFVRHQVAPEDFYQGAHGLVWEACCALYDRRVALDPVTIKDELARRGRFDDAGGMAALAHLWNFVPSAENAEHYAQLVAERALLRRLVQVAGEIRQEALAVAEEPAQILDRAQARVLDLTEHRTTRDITDLRAVMDDLIKRLIEQPEGPPGLGTPLPVLTRMLGGFRPGELIIIAARPSVGKSALALRLAEHLAADHQVPVAFFSLEMSALEIGQRLLAMRARVPLERLRNTLPSEAESARLADAAALLSDAPLFLDDSSVLTPAALRAKARRLTVREGVRLVIVDYLQLMDPGPGPGGQREGRQEQVARLSRTLKHLARELKVPVICLSQLNRESEYRDKSDFRPRLADLRESGAIEQDADVVMLLHRREMFPNCPEDERHKAELILAKQRSGPTGTVRMFYQREFVRFEQLEERFSEADAEPHAAAAGHFGGPDDEPY